MKIAVTGSIATDHLMSFPGRFADQLIADQLDKVSLSFLVDELVLRRGGTAANIAFGMAQLGLRPVLLGAVGADFADYRSWLERHGVDCDSVHVSEVAHTARFVCTTDTDMCQIASFYAGAMSEARNIELHPVAQRLGGLDLVLVSANDPAAMIRHSGECRDRGYAFVADPSQQLARMDGADVLGLVEGADYLMTNEYEKSLLQSKAGLTDEQLLDRVKVRVTTLGKQGVEIAGREVGTIRVPIAREIQAVDPTGCGDAYRGGLLYGLAEGWSWDRAARLGSVMGAIKVESQGPQNHVPDRAAIAARHRDAYGSSPWSD